MKHTIAIPVDGLEVLFELDPADAPDLAPASAEAATIKASKTFEQSIAAFAGLARKFAEAMDGPRVTEAEITMGLKVTAKGDFVVVGTTGEASLTLKLKLMPSKAG